MQSIGMRSSGWRAPRRVQFRPHDWRGGSRPEWVRRGMGVGLAVVGLDVGIHTLPWLIWPIGLGLWLVWAGLGPLVMAGAVIWIGWRVTQHHG